MGQTESLLKEVVFQLTNIVSDMEHETNIITNVFRTLQDREFALDRITRITTWKRLLKIVLEVIEGKHNEVLNDNEQGNNDH